MRFRDMIGQSFRDATGMPPKVSSYNSKLKLYSVAEKDNKSEKEVNARALHQSERIAYQIQMIRWRFLIKHVRRRRCSPLFGKYVKLDSS